MKSILFLSLSFLFISCSGNKDYDTVNIEADYQIIPKPQQFKISKGRFLIDNKTKIAYENGLEAEGDFLSEFIGVTTGYQLSLVSNPEETEGNIKLIIDDSIEHEEGYRLDIQTDSIVIAGRTAKGVFYGIQTFRQLIPAAVEGRSEAKVVSTIPTVLIEDEPRFGYRGMLLDVARHYFPVSFLKKYIDLMAMHKMNMLQLHLTDDQGWRIEIKKYPKLTEIGAFRNGTIIGHYPGKENDQTKYGGFYTQDEIKEIVAYAADRNITVIPEIEMPGHASAAIAAYPFLSCFPKEPTVVPENMISEKGKELQLKGTPKIVQESWGVFPDVFCAGNDQTFDFLEDVLDEVMLLFPSKYIHIGGDENPKDNWKRCPQCQARIKELGLKDEHSLQSYFIQRIEKYVNSKGNKIIGWDEILEGGLAPNATVMSWRGEKGGIEAANQHHEVIMTPTDYCYFDYYQVEGEEQSEEPLAIGGFLPVKKVYLYEPLTKALSDEKQKYILGAQANLWTEYITTEAQVEYMILPRMTALSEVVWSASETKDWNDFKSRFKRLSKTYDAMDLNYAKHILSKNDK